MVLKVDGGGYRRKTGGYYNSGYQGGGKPSNVGAYRPMGGDYRPRVPSSNERGMGGDWAGAAAAAGATQAERDFLAEWAASQNPAPPPRPSYPSSGGSSGAAAAAADRAKKVAQIDQSVKDFRAASKKDREAALKAMAQFDAYAGTLGNPWESIGPARQVMVDPRELSTLLRSQGMDDAGLRAEASYLRAENGSTARAMDRLAKMLAAGQTSWNQSVRTEGKLASGQQQAELAAQLAAFVAAAEKAKAAL